MIYYQFFSVSNVTWHKSLHGSKILESLQRRACWIACKDISSGEPSSDFLLKSLYVRHDKYVLKLVRRCTNGNIPEYFENYFTKRHMNVHDQFTKCHSLFKNDLDWNMLNLPSFIKEPLFLTGVNSMHLRPFQNRWLMEA